MQSKSDAFEIEMNISKPKRVYSFELDTRQDC